MNRRGFLGSLCAAPVAAAIAWYPPKSVTPKWLAAQTAQFSLQTFVLKKGDIFTIDGVYAPCPMGDVMSVRLPQRFVITSEVTA